MVTIMVMTKLAIEHVHTVICLLPLSDLVTQMAIAILVALPQPFHL